MPLAIAVGYELRISVQRVEENFYHVIRAMLREGTMVAQAIIGEIRAVAIDAYGWESAFSLPNDKHEPQAGTEDSLGAAIDRVTRIYLTR
jgi:hypothetical protein